MKPKTNGAHFQNRENAEGNGRRCPCLGDFVEGAAVGIFLLLVYQADSVPTFRFAADWSRLAPHGFDFMGNLMKLAIRIGCVQVSSDS